MDDFVAEFGVTHPLVILKTDALEKMIGVSGFPTSAVFTNGELTWSGHPAEAGGAVGKALKEAKKGSVYPKAFTGVRGMLRDGNPAKAYAEILKNEAKWTGNDADWAKRLKTWIEAESTAALLEGKAQAEAGFFYRAWSRAQGFAPEGSALPNAGEIREWLSGLETSTPEWKKEMSGGKAFEEALAQEKQLLFTEAFKSYKSVMKSGKGTRIGANAERAARAILDGRKSGYNQHCESCDAKEKRACNRHWEEVKL